MNRPDVMQRQGRQGHYPPPKNTTEIPGLEIAGEVAQVAPGVTRWNKGDKLMALVVGGGYAEYCLAFASHARRRGDYVGRNYEAAAVEGRIVQIAFLASSRLTVDLMRLMLKRLTHTGSTLRARAVADKAAIAQAVEKNVLPLLASGRVKPLIDSTLPLAQASAAHARMEGGKHIGMIVLTL